MWKENQYRQNTHLTEHWPGGVLRTWSHFYHVGPQESLRHPMIEALVIRPGYAAESNGSSVGHGRPASRIGPSRLEDHDRLTLDRLPRHLGEPFPSLKPSM